MHKIDLAESLPVSLWVCASTFKEAELDYFGTLLLVATVGSYEEKVRKLRKYCCLCRIKLFYYVSTTLEAVCSDKKPFKCESFSVDNELGNMLVSH